LSVGGYTFAPKVEPAARVEGVEDFDAWVRETHPELLSVHHQRLQSLVKARLEENEALPPGVVVNVRTSLSRRKG
jgi:hypothetical protein